MSFVPRGLCQYRAIDSRVDMRKWKHTVVLFRKLREVWHNGTRFEQALKRSIALATCPMTYGAVPIIFIFPDIEILRSRAHAIVLPTANRLIANALSNVESIFPSRQTRYSTEFLAVCH